jgi:uncharacterized protein YbjT (DUF2867 family)
MRRLTFLTISLAVLGFGIASCAGGGAGGGSRGAALVLVVGATGGTGQEVVKQSLAKGYKVRVLVRDEAKGREIFGDTVEYRVGNVRDTAALGPVVRGADYVISALGSNSQRDPENKPEFVDYGAVRDLATEARKAGVKHFVLVSSMGVTHPDHMLNKMFDNIMNWKLKGEDALRASGVPYTVVRPGGLRGGPAGQAGIRVLQGDPKGVTGQIPRSDVAAVCVNALGERQSLGKTFEVIGDTTAAVADWRAFFGAIRSDVG